MSKIIAIANQKGGVGKTTTCVNLAAYIAAMQKNALIVDIDPQGNATTGLGVDKRKLEYSVYNAIVGDCNGASAILGTTVEKLNIMPSNVNVAGVEIEMVAMKNREYILKSVLSPLRNHYDYIMIDCPPSLGLLTVNALTAADSVIIPIPGEFYALEGLGQLMNTIKLSKKHLNPILDTEGVVFTMFDGRNNLANSVADEVTRFFGKKVFKTRIPRNIRLSEAPGHGLPIIQFDPRSAGGIAYQMLAEEFLSRNDDTFTPLDNLKRAKLD